MADLAEVTEIMGKGQAWLPGKRVKFDFGDTGVILLDGVEQQVSNDNLPADATIRISFDNFKKMAKGELGATTAFMMGRLKIEGDMGVAMQLQQVTSKLNLGQG
ncbi:SCP2 sterol-binding domain-containing protein [Sphingomonas sp.]|uniref:SCP2 sterol-binding domain-containing protein n=1 Tax=Sphingomonas sp. TaxID=28214 RepID=UPI001D3A1DFB|nr:SCP2 sterol-binding domain-containing protein [Sphingomonas sp.]MBX9795388.1 SCP2 sterol-binding domain-containing protein [Sphingomonas sp.]